MVTKGASDLVSTRWVINIFIDAIIISKILRTDEPFRKSNSYILKGCWRTCILVFSITLQSTAKQVVYKLEQRLGRNVPRLAFRRCASYLPELQCSIRDISIHIALLSLTLCCSWTTCSVITPWSYSYPHYGSCLHSFWHWMNSSNLEMVSPRDFPHTTPSKELLTALNDHLLFLWPYFYFKVLRKVWDFKRNNCLALLFILHFVGAYATVTVFCY